MIAINAKFIEFVNGGEFYFCQIHSLTSCQH